MATTTPKAEPTKGAPIMVAPEGKGFFVFHTALRWDVAGPFRLRQDAYAEVKKRKKALGVDSWAVQLKDLKGGPKEKRDPALLAVTEHLAALLKETKKQPIETLMDIIKVCGLAYAEALYKETLEIEAKGGMPVKSVKNAPAPMRSRGGIFFYLARTRMTREQRDQVQQWKKRVEKFIKTARQHRVVLEYASKSEPESGSGTPPPAEGG